MSEREEFCRYWAAQDEGVDAPDCPKCNDTGVVEVDCPEAGHDEVACECAREVAA